MLALLLLLLFQFTPSGAPHAPSVAAPVVFINTTFNEASAGANLVGTTPATCANGCTGAWSLVSGADFIYQSGGGVLVGAINGQFDLIDSGTANGVVRANLNTCTGTAFALCQFAVRYVDIDNFVAINAVVSGSGAPSVTVYDVVGGTATPVAGPLNGTATGDYTITVSGTSITVANANGSITNSSTALHNTTGTKVGFSANGVGTSGTAMKMVSFSVKSQ